MHKTAKQVAFEFVDCINRHDVSGLVGLMTEDHRFVDGLGQIVSGREAMAKGWAGYFAWFPDYAIQLEQILAEADQVAVFGNALGTYAVNGKLLTENHWQIPAAWKAVVRDGQVAEWRVFADNEPVWKILGVKRY